MREFCDKVFHCSDLVLGRKWVLSSHSKSLAQKKKVNHFKKCDKSNAIYFVCAARIIVDVIKWKKWLHRMGRHTLRRGEVRKRENGANLCTNKHSQSLQQIKSPKQWQFCQQVLWKTKKKLLPKWEKDNERERKEERKKTHHQQKSMKYDTVTYKES